MLLIDGDIILYRVGFACQKTWYSVYLKDGLDFLVRLEGKTAVNAWLAEMDIPKDEVVYETEIVPEPLPNALHSVINMIEGMQKALQDYNFRIFLTGDNNFRHDVYPAYKGGRGDRPLLYNAIRTYLIEHWQAEVVHGEEADDAMARAQNKDTVICTIDKDLLMVPGQHYNFITEEYQIITEKGGWFLYCGQLLSGDSVDNICGIRGVGKKTADKLIYAGELAELDPMETVQFHYKEYWGEDWEEVLECNKQLIWMRRE